MAGDGVRSFGQGLRVPFFAGTILIWITCIAPIVLLFNLDIAILQIYFYPIAILIYIWKAFSGADPDWPSRYWDDFPINHLRSFIKWLKSSYSEIHAWLINGFEGKAGPNSRMSFSPLTCLGFLTPFLLSFCCFLSCCGDIFRPVPQTNTDKNKKK